MTLAPTPTTCHWVPGTLDRVRVRHGGREEALHVTQVVRRFGRAALDALYLQGRYIDRSAARS